MAAVEVVSDSEVLARRAADQVIAQLEAAVQTHGSATWVLAGGTSPTAAYRVLAAQYRDNPVWPHVRVVLGDERCVPADHSDSNWKAATEAFLSQVAIPEAALLRPKGELSAELAADDYEKILLALPHGDNALPRLDVVWLGVGEDGHTLSLFPGRPDATDHLVIPVHNSPKPPSDRISLTLKALEGAASCTILSAGAGKAEVIARALQGDMSLPIARAVAAIENAGGQVTWLLDKAAADKA